MGLQNPPQQDYQSIITTTGRGFKQSIIKFEDNITGLTPMTGAGGFISGAPLTARAYSFDGSTFVFSRPGFVEVSVTIQVLGAPVVANNYVLLVFNATSVADYVYRYSTSGGFNKLAFKFMAEVLPTHSLNVSLNAGNSGATGFNVLDYNIRLY